MIYDHEHDDQEFSKDLTIKAILICLIADVVYRVIGFFKRG